jgi:DMSO/TMAO reductase YedYZ heme-binding membrane subunit
MTRKAKARGPLCLVVVAVVAVLLTAALVSLRPYGSPLNWLTRGAALLGYLAIFLGIISSAYVRWLVTVFGRPFVHVHHMPSIAGLILLTLHPLGAVLDWGSASVLLPNFESLSTFLRWGGPPALYLIAIASLAAALRKLVDKQWRTVHTLSYIAFLLGTFHATMLGTDFAGAEAQSIIAKIVAILMAIAVAATFAQKRLPRRK